LLAGGRKPRGEGRFSKTKMVEDDAAWHSTVLYYLYQSLGWFAFTVWSVSFYPQVILNYRRKSVTGLTMDFLLMNFTKHSMYLIYNASLYFSPVVQQQYREKYGETELIPVAPSDVAFSIHAVILTSFTLYQVAIYDRGDQKASQTAVGLTAIAWGSAVIFLFIAWPKGDWLWLVSCFNIIQLIFTSIKYIPQAYFNYTRKSTIGWSIGNIILDMSGGLSNFAQMGVQSIDQHSVQNFTGNVGKIGLSLESVLFDVLFIVQHYFLYPHTESRVDEYLEIEEADPVAAS
jgi:cystinosin